MKFRAKVNPRASEEFKKFEEFQERLRREALARV